MNPFEAYKTYLAVKNHFDREGYDYFKYAGKVPVKIDSFYARKDRYFFEKLSRKKDFVNFLVANFIVNDKSYARDLTHEEAETNYRNWVQRTSSFTYKFKQDLDAIPDLREAITVHDGQHPELLKLYMKNKIMLETVIALDHFIKFVDVWDKKIEDTLLWPTIKRKLVKYRPFFKFDRDKIKDVILEKYRNKSE